jgi:hypothetical protein
MAGRAREWSRPAWGLAGAVVLVLLAGVVPVLVGVDVEGGTAAPLLADWRPRVGPGTIPALVVAWFVVSGRLASWAARLPWRRALGVAYGLALAWLLSLALVDGIDGVAAPLDADAEYLPTARSVGDVGAMLSGFVDRIPVDAPDRWATHVAGHPPGALLAFVALDRIGLGSGAPAGLVVVLAAASVPVAVAQACRVLGGEDGVRRALPFLVVGPAAIWFAVSADALFAAVSAWGLAALAVATRARSRTSAVLWSVGAGLLLGATVMLSYGLALVGAIALGVLVVGRSWRPLPVVAVAATGVVVAFAAVGFRYWEALPLLHDRYYAGLARVRPAWYWVWANLAVLVVSAGPALAAALAEVAPRLPRLLREREPLAVLAVSSAVAVLAADLSLMSKAETERIWLPFMPWLLLLTAHLPPVWRRRCLALQVVVALVVQHLLWSRW